MVRKFMIIMCLIVILSASSSAFATKDGFAQNNDNAIS